MVPNSPIYQNISTEIIADIDNTRRSPNRCRCRATSHLSAWLNSSHGLVGGGAAPRPPRPPPDPQVAAEASRAPGRVARRSEVNVERQRKIDQFRAAQAAREPMIEAIYAASLAAKELSEEERQRALETVHGFKQDMSFSDFCTLRGAIVDKRGYDFFNAPNHSKDFRH